MSEDSSRCLVVGGGGVAGIAWATGLLYGLEQRGFHLRRADRLVGTSAGSAVTAQLTSPATLEHLYERQLAGSVKELTAGLGPLGMARLAVSLLLRRSDTAARRSIGTFAATRGRDRANVRTEVIRARLDGAQWNPEHDLRLPAINIATGEREVFTADGRATLAEAVEASCAVPGVWAPVTIAGERYMDGGVPSTANIDLARGCRTVVVIAPMARAMRRSRSPRVEIEQLRAANPGSRSVLITPDEESLAAIGPNSLDPGTREYAAKAGLAQAERAQGSLAGVWPQEPHPFLDPGQ